MPKRNRVVLLLLMPMVIFVWLIGMSLYRVGAKREAALPQPDLSRQKDSTYIVPVPEQTFEALASQRRRENEN
jgi:hypothetical protein